MNRKIKKTFLFVFIGTLSLVASLTIGTDSTLAEDLGSSTPVIRDPIAIPELAVKIPGLLMKPSTCTETECTTPWLPEYINGLYQYGLGAITILAVITMMIAGIIWVTAGGKQERIANAKEWVGGSLIGVLIAFTSYMILNFVNPALTKLSPLKITYMQRKNLPDTIAPHEEDGLTGLEGRLTNVDNTSTSGTSNTNCGCPWEFQRDYTGVKFINEAGTRTGDIGPNGCGAIATWVVARCQGKNYNLDQWIQLMGKYKVGAGADGSYSSQMPDLFKGIGLNTAYFDSAKSAGVKMDELQSQGKKPMMVIRVSGQSHGFPNCQFTKAGHFIAGFNKSGNSICINDSANRQGYNSRKKADLDQIDRDCGKKGGERTVLVTLVW